MNVFWDPISGCWTDGFTYVRASVIRSWIQNSNEMTYTKPSNVRGRLNMNDVVAYFESEVK